MPRKCLFQSNLWLQTDARFTLDEAFNSVNPWDSLQCKENSSTLTDKRTEFITISRLNVKKRDWQAWLRTEGDSFEREHCASV